MTVNSWIVKRAYHPSLVLTYPGVEKKMQEDSVLSASTDVSTDAEDLKASDISLSDVLETSASSPGSRSASPTKTNALNNILLSRVLSMGGNNPHSRAPSRASSIHSTRSSFTSVSTSVLPDMSDIDLTSLQILAPMNYCQVEKGIYRSGVPSIYMHSRFLKTLNLKTVVSLLADDIPQNLKEFYEENHITFINHNFGKGNKNHNYHIDDATCRRALETILNPSNHPVLIHCKKGKHRTGSIIGLIRRLRGWSMSSICQEYWSFEPKEKTRMEDMRFIESYDLTYLDEEKERDEN